MFRKLILAWHLRWMRAHPRGGITLMAAMRQWERTPRWIFWRPTWRRWLDYNVDSRWEYRTKKRLARDFLDQRFNNGVDREDPRTWGNTARRTTGRKAKI